MSQKTEIHIPRPDREWGRVRQSPKYFLLAEDPRPHGAEMAYVMFPSPNKINVIFSSKQLHCSPQRLSGCHRLIVVIRENIKSRLRGILLHFKDSVRPINV